LPKIAVVLFQLGGPDSIEAVEPFLYNVFLDSDLIGFPFASLAREPLARLLSSRRAPGVAEKYKQIGGKSPILEVTQQQASALQAEMRRDYDASIFVAMLYCHPTIDTIIRKLSQASYDKIVLLPLYPQYFKTTTGSCLNEWNRWRSAFGIPEECVETIYHFFDHPLYIDACVDRINEVLDRLGRERGDVTLVFSAHGVPLSVVRGGDPFKDQVEKTVELALKRGGWQVNHRLCYQSKVGPAKWLRPSLDETLSDLGHSGVTRVLVVPISFVGDQLETLHEINIEAREFAYSLGIKEFEMTPGLNAHPNLIAALADLIRDRCRF
jgi:ferrochelatase